MLKQNDEVGKINKKRKATNSDKNDKVISKKISEFYTIRSKHASSVQTKQPNMDPQKRENGWSGKFATNRFYNGR